MAGWADERTWTASAGQKARALEMALHDDDRDPTPCVEPTAPAALDIPPVTRHDASVIEARVAVLARDVRLSSRERTVLRLIALGYRYREIGCAMSISPRTVKMYASNLRRKVGGETRWDLMRRVLVD
jgi:DNA-binding CsgD family transcriptional regulator